MRNCRATLSLSAILLFSSIPFTYVAIIPLVMRMKRIEGAIVKGGPASYLGACEEYGRGSQNKHRTDPQAGSDGVDSERLCEEARGVSQR